MESYGTIPNGCHALFWRWPVLRGPIMSDLRVLILAAGKGTRMKSRKAKVLHQVGGASLVEHVLTAARSVSSSVSIVIGHQAETVRALMPEASFVEQKEQLGTGHAVMVAREQLSTHKGDLLIL